MRLLVPLALAEAYGAGFEDVPEEFVRKHNTLTAYKQHPRHAIAPGRYTDDTQMSIAVAEALLSGKPLTRELFAEMFVTCFKRDPRVGYASSFYDFLVRIADGAQFLAEIKPFSDRNGAAMRAPVIGVLPDISQVIEVATLQAKLTHDTTAGINSAVAAALMSHYFLYTGGDKANLGTWLESKVPGNWSKPWQGKVGAKAWMAVQAAITAITANTSLSAILKQCVDFTGDVDTVAAIALAAASQSTEIAQDLPLFLYDGLEQGTYGRCYLAHLDALLTTTFVLNAG